MKNTKIGWCHHTVNFWWGCKKVSAACKYCYAATLDAMRGPLFDNGRVHWGPDAPRWVKTDSATKELRSISRSALKRGVRERVFINSMSDTFEDHPQLPAARAILFAELVKHPHLDFLLLTKRPENVREMVPAEWLKPGQWPSHVWVGTTVENQEMAELRVPVLLEIPAQIRFLSCEPLLGPVNLRSIAREEKYSNNPEDDDSWTFFDDALTGFKAHKCGGSHGAKIDWVICGGESGREARPMNPDWARSIRDQCTAADDVPFFFKQWGEWVRPVPDSKFYDNLESCIVYADPAKPSNDFRRVYRVGTKHSGRTLDKRTWDEVPA